jgi:arylsulfatase A-like enzyme
MKPETWQKTYPMQLKKAGYMIGFAGKFGFDVSKPEGGKAMPEGDFDMWGGAPGQSNYSTKANKSMAKYAEEFPHSSRSYGAFSRDFIKSATDEKKPFCLSISFKASHFPMQPDPEFDHVYADTKFKKPANYGREFGLHFAKQSQQGRQYDRFVSWKYRDDYDGAMRPYHQLIYGVDVAVGMIREALKASGADKNTVIIYTSDNGFFCGSHGLGSKVLLYEEATKVPLIIYDPRHKNSGKKLRCDAITGNIDFAPTILELAGLDPLPNMDGKSLMTLYDDPTASIHEQLALINVWGPKAMHSYGVVTKTHKFVYWPYETGEFEATEELYNLEKDPTELKNLAANPEQAPALKKMRATYDEMVAHWRANAADYNNYQPYGDIFDRNIPWTPAAQKKRPDNVKPGNPKKRDKKKKK